VIRDGPSNAELGAIVGGMVSGAAILGAACLSLGWPVTHPNRIVAVYSIGAFIGGYLAQAIWRRRRW
jgi:hypothetical protein